MWYFVNFVHQVGDQPRLYYDARSTNHQDIIFMIPFQMQQSNSGKGGVFLIYNNIQLPQKSVFQWQLNSCV
jgi:hypothetical protein